MKWIHKCNECGHIGKLYKTHNDYCCSECFSRSTTLVKNKKDKLMKELQNKILQWAHARGILTNSSPQIQGLKLVSEIGELCDNLAKGRDIRDDIGDAIVVLTIIANMKGTTLEECMEVAYNDIKDRKGYLNSDGIFIKETDQLTMSFTDDRTIVKLECIKSIGPDISVNFILTLSDNNTIKVILSQEFQDKYPEGIIGLTVDQLNKTIKELM